MTAQTAREALSPQFWLQLAVILITVLGGNALAGGVRWGGLTAEVASLRKEMGDLRDVIKQAPNAEVIRLQMAKDYADLNTRILALESKTLAVDAMAQTNRVYITDIRETLAAQGILQAPNRRR